MMQQKCKKSRSLTIQIQLFYYYFSILIKNIFSKTNSFHLCLVFIKMEFEYVILVDENDQEIGSMEKQEAHEKGLLHRAFSVFVFNENKELLVQQRALTKYHSAGLWTNTCCSHPRIGETIEQAAHRRLMEEMGFDCELNSKSSFIYKVAFENGLTEHELDYVLIGTYNGPVQFNKEEVASCQWVALDKVASDCKSNPELYTVWFRHILAHHLQEISQL
jgi:isopentenyl-diphosphate delta-isomerase